MTEHEGCRLRVDVRPQSGMDGGILAGAVSYSVDLSWTPTSVSFFDHSTGTENTIDFVARERRTADIKSQTFFSEPIHQLPGSRWIEARNQQFICGVLTAGGQADNDFASPLVEHALSVLLPGSKTRIRKESLFSGLFGGRDSIRHVDDGGSNRFSFAKRSLLSVAADGPMNADAANAYAHFLRARFGGHPALLEHLSRRGQLPTSLTIASLEPMQTGGEVTVQAELARVTPAGRGFEQVPAPLDGSESVDKILQATTWQTAAGTPDERISRSLSLVHENREVEGLLVFLELALEQGTAMPPELAGVINTSNDQDLDLLLTLLRPMDDEEAARLAIQGFERLRGPAGEQAHLLGTFEASVRRALKEPMVAIELLTQALVANPRLTGAYKDLGDLFLQMFDSRRAWMCWSRARSIAPGLELLQDVTAFEEALGVDNSAYFLWRTLTK